MSHSRIPAPCESETFWSLLSRFAKSSESQGKVNLVELAVLPHPLVTLLPSSGALPEQKFAL